MVSGELACKAIQHGRDLHVLQSGTNAEVRTRSPSLPASWRSRVRCPGDAARGHLAYGGPFGAIELVGPLSGGAAVVGDEGCPFG